MINKFAIAIHGGAGTVDRNNMTPEQEAQYHSHLNLSLKAGFQVLKQGGTATQAVIEAIKVMEDSPLFNAGRGSVLNSQGDVSMEASIMEGQNLKAGAIIGLTRIQNPIVAAHKVMTETQHIILAGEAAEQFAIDCGCKVQPKEYFLTERRVKQLAQIKAINSKKVLLDHDSTNLEQEQLKQSKIGTVGAVALDKFGNIASGTSTGGMTNKLPGRVGQAAVFGCGTYSNNKTCAISCTGDGEQIIRANLSYDISAMIQYGKLSLKEASDSAIQKIKKQKGSAGLVGIDTHGNIVMPFSTSGMYRGYVKEDEKYHTEIYKSQQANL